MNQRPDDDDDLPTDGPALRPQGGRRHNWEPQNGRHEHELQWMEGIPKYKCGGCKASGANVGYKCGTCSDFVLHESCASLVDGTQHARFPGHQLYFQHERTGRGKYCNACEEKLLGCVFQTPDGQLKFHPLCLDIPDTFFHTELGLDNQGRRYVFKCIFNNRELVCMTCARTTLKWKYYCRRYQNGVYLDMNCALLYFHGLSFPNVERLQPTNWNIRILEMLSTGTRYVGDKLCRSFWNGLGEGTAMACCPLIYNKFCGNDDGTEEENGASEAGNAGDADGDGNDSAGQ